jgi:hydroxymethylpyrimidine pyrophosphatase-like HAD family hydrolase
MTSSPLRPDVVSADWRELVAAAGVRMVATDLDGTLLRRDHTVSERTVAALARARAAGFPVVFVTGRPPRWVPPVLEVTGHSGIGVCANGAIVLDLETHELLDVHPIAPDVVAEVVGILRESVPGLAFGVEYVRPDGVSGFAHERSYRVVFPDDPAVLVADDVLDLVEGVEVVKLLARVELDGPAAHHDADTLLDLTLSHVRHLVNPTHSVSSDVLIEIGAADVSKGAALERQAARLGIPVSAVAAVGDMPNDVPMLRWAGVGLAVETAHPAALAAADALVPSPAEDGVAQLVEAALDGLERGPR